MSKKTGWQQVGNVWVDSGSIMLGDPCYTHGEDASSAVKDWNDFLARTWPEVFGKDGGINHDADMEKVANALGQPGIGVVVSSGFGDGNYPVYVRYSDEGNWGVRVAEVKVVFIDEDGSMANADYPDPENED